MKKIPPTAYTDYEYLGGPQRFGPYSEKNYLKLTKLNKKKTRPYVHWRNENQKDCKTIGPSTKCFCNHRYKQHNYLNLKENDTQIKCLEKKCNCKQFFYVPIHGS